MNDDVKKVIVISVIFLILIIVAWHSISVLKEKAQVPLLQPPTQDAAEAIPLSGGNPPIVYLPTPEEIEKSIADQNQKRKAMEELMAARDRKAEKVLAAVHAAASSPESQEATAENKPPTLSPEARAERNKELRDGIKAHIYFPR